MPGTHGTQQVTQQKNKLDMFDQNCAEHKTFCTFFNEQYIQNISWAVQFYKITNHL